MKLALQTLLAMTFAVPAVPALAQADGFPTRPMRMIVPWRPGGSVDPFARLLSQKLPELMRQQVVVDCRPGGRKRPIAVTSPKRSSVMPDLPTIAESGVPGYSFSAWYGVLMPAGAPRGIVSAWNAAIVKALRSPDMAERIAREGADVIASSPEEFRALIKTEIAK